MKQQKDTSDDISHFSEQAFKKVKQENLSKAQVNYLGGGGGGGKGSKVPYLSIVFAVQVVALVSAEIQRDCQIVSHLKLEVLQVCY